MKDLPALPALACAGFASMVAMRLCDAMLPALAQDFGTTPVDAARTISAFALAYGLLQLVYGPLGDRFGKPRVVSVAAGGCAVAAVLAALAPSLDWLASGRLLMGAFAAGVIPMTMAWVGDRVPYERRQEVLARLLTWTVLGMMLGSWAGGALAELAGWRSAFIGVGVLFLAASLGVGRAARGDTRIVAAARGSAYLSQVASMLRSPWTRRVLAIVFMEGALVFGALAFIPTTLHDRFRLTLVAAGGVVALFGLGGLLYSRLAGRWLRTLGAPRLAVSGAACLAFAMAMLAVMPHWSIAAASCLLAGLGFYMLHNTLQTCATQLSPTARGTGVSVFVAALFLGQSCGVATAALVVDRLSSAAWFAAASPLLLALGLYFASHLKARLTIGEAGA
jgi:predicted MFS family arabinose efflux permease